MKKDYRKVIMSLDTDVTCIPERINSTLDQFENEHAKHPVYRQNFCGYWSGLQYNSRKVYVHKDDLDTLKSKYPKYF